MPPDSTHVNNVELFSSGNDGGINDIGGPITGPGGYYNPPVELS